jgi:hypothetical protein
MPHDKIPVNRGLVGILTLGCLAGAVVAAIVNSWDSPLAAALLRTGVLLGAFWLALPSKGRQAAWANVSPWTLAICLVLGVLFVRRPRIFFPIIAVVALAALFLRPRRR